MKHAIAIAAVLGLLGLSGCESEATRANQNLTQAADNFEIQRRVSFVSGVTDNVILTIEGLCSISNGQTARSVLVTCKTGSNQFLRHQLGLAESVTFVVEQMSPARASGYHYRYIVRPASLIPTVEVR